MSVGHWYNCNITHKEKINVKKGGRQSSHPESKRDNRRPYFSEKISRRVVGLPPQREAQRERPKGHHFNSDELKRGPSVSRKPRDCWQVTQTVDKSHQNIRWTKDIIAIYHHGKLRHEYIAMIPWNIPITTQKEVEEGYWKGAAKGPQTWYGGKELHGNQN